MVYRRTFLQQSLAATTLVSQQFSQLHAQTEPQPSVLAFVGCRLLPITSDPIDDGCLVIAAKKIAAVGKRSEVSIPAGATTIDCNGKWIMPGLVCTHSHVGGAAAADGSQPIQPGVRVLDSLNIYSSGFRRALAGGLTTLNIMPGSGHLISGQTVYTKLRFFDDHPRTIEDILLRDPSGQPLGGLKMANGTNSIGDNPFPGTRGKSAFLVREQYIKAREYHAKVQKAAGDPEKLPDRNLHFEALVEAMQGKRIVHHHTHRHDDIMTVLRVANEFGLQVVLHHVSEGWRVARELAEARVPCSLILLDSPGGKLEAENLVFKNARVLDEHGVRIAFHTDDWITDSRLFARMAAMAVRAGLSRARALDALTVAGAEMLGVQDRLGSLQAGKDADFAVWSGDPLSVYAHVEQTWVEGQLAFDRWREADRLLAEGGFGAGEQVEPYLCCVAKQSAD